MQLLSALVKNGTEYFTESDLRHAVNAGKITVIELLPQDFFDLLFQELENDRPAQRSLDKLGIYEVRLRVEKFFDCNYSRFSGDADVTTCGKLGDREVVNCKHRDTCPHEGKLCRLPNGLTRREAQISRAITIGLMDAEITHNLFISQSTLRNHKNNIEAKIGKTGKTAIGIWTYSVGLLYIKN